MAQGKREEPNHVWLYFQNGKKREFSSNHVRDYNNGMTFGAIF